MSAHTPGPLYPRKNTAGMWEICVGDREYSHSTAFVSSPIEHAEADARLYAAAPDLLAALNEALAIITDYLDYEHNGDPWSEDARAMGEMDINDYERDGRLEAARALVAKATGSAA